MTIIYLSDIDRLKAEDASLIAPVGTYTSVEATVTLNCGTELVQEYTVTELVDNTSKFYVTAEQGVLYFRPEMFGLTVFIDGVYYIRLRLWYTVGGYVGVENCTFADITFKCRVAQLLKDVMAGGTSTTAHLLHYSLVNGSNCGCNCDDMCANFATLEEILPDSTSQIKNDCGCN